MWIAVTMMLACGGGEGAAVKESDQAKGSAEADPNACVVHGVVMTDNKLHPGSYAWAERLPDSKVALMKGTEKVAEVDTIREGAYTFEPVPPGKYEVKGHRKGFKAMTLPVECTAGGKPEAKLFLELTAKGLEERGRPDDKKGGKAKGKKGE